MICFVYPFVTSLPMISIFFAYCFLVSLILFCVEQIREISAPHTGHWVIVQGGTDYPVQMERCISCFTNSYNWLHAHSVPKLTRLHCA